MQIENSFKSSANVKNDIHKPIFARHETFQPRYGWLKKGYEKVIEYPDLFLRENATVILGVGKNMVRSIRYWMMAFKILEEIQQRNKKITVFKPTNFANELLSFNGWDPYLANQSSLWLLHWYLLKSPCKASAWYFVFNEFHKSDFTSDDLLRALVEYVYSYFPNIRISENSLKKDIGCILRMYGEKGLLRIKNEDSIDSPFSELAIIRNTSDKKSFYFVSGNKPGLTPEIIVSSCLEYTSIYNPGLRTISITQLLYNVGSPGLVYRLTESNVCEAIEKLSSQNNSIHLGESAGIIQFSYDDDPLALSKNILRKYYSV